MPESPIKLVDSLQVEQLDRYLFKGLTPKPSMPRIFGGQVLAQAMNAGARTVENDRVLHSFHAYFLRPGNPDKQIIFDVDPIRDGGSFTTRRVIAKQDGKAIYNCSLSFMTHTEGYSHQQNITINTDPEQLETTSQRNTRLQEKYPHKFKTLPEIFPEWDIRYQQDMDPVSPAKRPPHMETWLRFTSAVNNSKLLNQTLLAYVSDLGLMAAAFLPHGISVYSNNIQTASLDHAMWFHAPCNINEWVLYTADSHWSGNGRGLNIGKLYDQNGLLLATAVQEGLMRPPKK